MIRHRSILSFLVCLSLGVALSAVASTDSCERLIPSLSPQWAVDGAFETPQVLLLADPWDREVIRYDLATRTGGQVRGHLAKTLSDLGPISVQPRNSGFAIRLVKNRLLLLDRWMRPEGVRDLKNEPALEGFTLQTLDVVGNTAISCFDRKLDEKNWEHGFIQVPLNAPAEYRELAQFPRDSTERLACKVLGPYVARVGDSDYVLILEKRPRIYKVLTPAEVKKQDDGDGPLMPLEAFPAGFTQRPDLPDMPLGQEYEMVMNALQFSVVPVAMYGQGAHLYVVTRSSLGGGAVEWKVTKIDPDKDRVVGSAVLPTTRPHVVPVPGPANWAFLEKGPAISWDEPHPVERILLVPTHRIQTLGSGPASDLCD